MLFIQRNLVIKIYLVNSYTIDKVSSMEIDCVLIVVGLGPQ